MSIDRAFTKENLDGYLKELGKETSRQILLHREQKEKKVVTESSAEDIIRKALAKKLCDRDER